MIEIPEAVTLAAQLEDTVRGKRIAAAEANHSPHKWAWFHGDPRTYGKRLAGTRVLAARAHGGMVEVDLGKRLLVYAEGVSVRLHEAGTTLPVKHQLLVRFEDGTSLSSSVQMYGGSGAGRRMPLRARTTCRRGTNRHR